MIRSLLGRATIGLLLALALLWSTFPIFFMVSGAFKPAARIWSYPPTLIAEPTLANFGAIQRFHPMFWSHMLNSVIVTVSAALLTVVLALATAFVLSRLRHGWLRMPVLLLILVRMFPPIIVIIPLFPAMNALGLLDTLTPLVLAAIAFSLSIATLLLKTFVDDIPIELEEAAMIDGCSRLTAFIIITVPLIAPAIGAIALIVAIGAWNEYLFPLVFTSSAARTAPVSIALALSADDGVSWGMLMAMATVHLLPPLILVALLHRQLVTVMTMGAVKG